MKKILGIFVLLSLIAGNLAFAQEGEELMFTTTATKTYTSSESFLKDYGKTCEVATDGCNTVQIWNGKTGASTMMYCEHIYGEKGQENWSCLKEIGKLSVNDQNQYDAFKQKLPQKYIKQVENFMTQYKAKLKTLSETKQTKINSKAIEVLQEATYNIIMKYPQDKALPTQVNNNYMMLTLLKLELMK